MASPAAAVRALARKKRTRTEKGKVVFRPLKASRRLLNLLADKFPAQPGVDYVRPNQMMRADCKGGPRPCPLVSCQHHLALEVTKAGSIKMNFPDLEVSEMTETCALDVADRIRELGDIQALEVIAHVLNVVPERARKILIAAISKLERKHGKELRELAEQLEIIEPRRRLPLLGGTGR